ncbi:MAG: zf-HC2 domain-containing protein [Deltaproteobacteria bacterium]|nr:zf-HC2 domain-containing protein [Deltaproteobacteria bacterium]
MTCEPHRSRLSAHVDGMLASGERAEVDRHLRECEDCRERLASIRAVKHAIARLPSKEDPPGAIRARIEALRFGERRPRRSLTWALVALACLLIIISGTFVLIAAREDQTGLFDELVADHLRSMPEAMPAEVASHDPSAVVRFFTDRTPFAPVAPELPRFQLVGGRLCRIKGRLFELLFYETNGETLSLFISDHPSADRSCYESRDHQVCTRSKGRLTLHLVGKRPPEELLALLDEASWD